MPPDIGPVAAEELVAFLDVGEAAFGHPLQHHEVEREGLVFEPDRALAVREHSRMVATACSYRLLMAVPGGQLPVAGVSGVAVRPTHRRRGLMSALLRRQLDELGPAGEPVAALWASEAAIYARFGYGLASRLLRLSLPRTGAELRSDAPSGPHPLSLGTAAEQLPALRAVHEVCWPSRPGGFHRDERWWAWRLHDPEQERAPRQSALQAVVAHEDAGPVGYALYRTRPGWSGEVLPDGELTLSELAATTPAATADLWRYLCGVDLMSRLVAGNRPVDDPLLLWLTDTRQARPLSVDALWVRLVRLPEALAGRRYAAPVDVVLEIRDPDCRWNDGRWRLCGDPTGACCDRSTEPADLSLPVSALGAAYLGGTSLTSLGAAGWVTEQRGGALAAASAAFRHDPAPFCPVVF